MDLCQSGCPEELPWQCMIWQLLWHTYELAIVSEAIEGLLGNQKARKGTLKLKKRFKVNAKQTKMMISSKNAGKITHEGSFLVLLAERVKAVIPLSARFDSITCIRDESIRGELIEGSKTKYQICVNHKTDKAENCQGIKLKMAT